MRRTFPEKTYLVFTYLSRSILKMFTPNVSQDFRHLIEDLTENDKSFARKIDDAYESLSETAHLIKRLETELNLKIEKVSTLKQDYERYSQLSNIGKGESQALLNQLDKSLNKGKFTDYFWAFVINLVTGGFLFTLGLYWDSHIKPFLGIGA